MSVDVYSASINIIIDDSSGPINVVVNGSSDFINVDGSSEPINVIVGDSFGSVSVSGSVEPINVSVDRSSESINVIVDDLVVTSYTAFPQVYVFENPSLVWTINHNLGRKVMPQVYTLGGVKMEGNIIHLNDNTLQVSFTTPMAGYVILI